MIFLFFLSFLKSHLANLMHKRSLALPQLILGVLATVHGRLLQDALLYAQHLEGVADGVRAAGGRGAQWLRPLLLLIPAHEGVGLRIVGEAEAILQTPDVRQNFI
jgi:hypothetical protein